MKKLSVILAMILSCAAMAFCAVGCGGGDSGNGGTGGNGGNENPPTQTDLLQFDGVALADLSVTYDGESHSLAVSGNVPADTTVTYNNNGKTNAGEYTVTVTLDKEGYETKTLTAKLTINKAEFTGVEFKGATYVHTGSVRSLAVSGALPEGTTVDYKNNDKKEIGEYTVMATLTNPNYNTKTLSAKLIIKSIPVVALDVINALLDKPDPWAFLPAALLPEKMAYASAPVGGVEGFGSFVEVGQIGKRSIGKQLHVLYEGLIDTASLLGKVDTVLAVGSTIANVYQTFVNDNPDDYAQFSGSAAGFSVKIVLDGNKSTMLVGNSTVSLELEYDKASEQRVGRIQVTDGAALKYVASPNALKLAVKTTVSGVGNVKQIEFARDGMISAGYLMEYTGTETKNLKTSGVILCNDKITAVMSNKRESDDLKINGYEEVYSSVTGEMIGGRVLETVKAFDYDTLWLHLSDVEGFDSVKVLDEANGVNADTIYLNEHADPIKVKSTISPPSRQFDIEMRDVWYVVKQEKDGKTEYEVQKMLVPMLFVQESKASAFSADMIEKNPYLTKAELPTGNIADLAENFDMMKEAFDEVKTTVTYQEIMGFIGSKNAFFGA